MLLLRVKRIIEISKVEEAKARKMMQRYASSRRVFAKKYFNAGLEDPINCDLIINTERFL